MTEMSDGIDRYVPVDLGGRQQRVNVGERLNAKDVPGVVVDRDRRVIALRDGWWQTNMILS